MKLKVELFEQKLKTITNKPKRFRIEIFKTKWRPSKQKFLFGSTSRVYASANVASGARCRLFVEPAYFWKILFQNDFSFCWDVSQDMLLFVFP